MSRFTVFLVCIPLGLHGCTFAISRNSCVSSSASIVDKATGQVVQFEAMPKPPELAAELIRAEGVVEALSSTEPHQVIWYEAAPSRILLTVAWTDGHEEEFQFERVDGAQYHVTSYFVEFCAG